MKKIFWYGIVIWFSAIAGLLYYISVDKFHDEPLDDTTLTELIGGLIDPVMPMPRPKWLDSRSKYTDEDYTCMTDNVYHEARGEPTEGQRAVVGVVFARIKDTSGRWPNTVCKVIYQYKAFSWTLEMPPVHDPMKWLEIRHNVEQWMESSEPFPAGNADHYHADYMIPYWASSMQPLIQIGAHKFYASF